MYRQFLLQIYLLSALALFGFNHQNISFQKFPLKEELPSSNVKRVFQDSRGYIWFGTESGICRYDGYKLVVIKSDIDHPGLLTSGKIHCIAEDKEHRIWFGTERGVNILDLNNQVVPLFKSQKFQELRINSILCDSKGKVWIGTENGLYVYHPKNGSIKSYFHSRDSRSIPGNNVNSIAEDRAGNIYITFWRDGMCMYDNKYDSFTTLPPFGKENNPYVITQDKDGVLWVGTWSDGLFKVDLSSSISEANYQQYLIPGWKEKSEYNNIYSIEQDKNTGHLWVLSQRGLSIVSDLKNVSFENINTLNIFADASNSLNQIIRDRQGNIWIATSNDGVYLANLHKPLFQSNQLRTLKQTNGYVTVNTILSVGNQVWLGLENYGVYVVNENRSNPSLGEEVKPLFPRSDSIMSIQINSLIYDKNDNSILIGGLNVFQRVTFENGVMHKVDLSHRVEKLLGRKKINVLALFCDSQKRIWMATRKGLVLLTNHESKMISIPFNNVVTIAEDPKGRIWAGSPSKGLMCVEVFGNSQFKNTLYSVSNQKINTDEINQILIDKRGEVWVATNNGGLNKYDATEDRFICQNKQYSILEEDIKSLVEDDNRHLWLATNNRIIKIDLQNSSSVLFSSTDKIETNSFRPGAVFMAKDQKLYFGGGNGYCSFYPTVKKGVSQPNNLSITDIQVHNNSIFDNFQEGIYDANQHILTLNYKQRNIGLEFSALNFVSAANISYAYKMSGIDKDWVYVDSKRRYVNYTGLSKGSYKFQVKSTDENGMWLNQVYTLNIDVEPAPYETWWAFLLYLLIIAAVTVTIFRFVRNRVQLRRDLIIAKIREEKTEELTQLKLKYFTNISHELLTPLTIISCLIEDFHFNYPDKYKQYNVMKSNINRLKRLLQQILDFRKVESGNMKLSVREADLAQFIQDICHTNFEPLVKKKNIQFTINGPEHLVGWFDKDKIDKILFNILSNAFKYTPIEGKIDLTIQSEIKNDLHYVRIFVSDTGKGIEPERLPLIFDRFYGNEMVVDSNGIGLSLTKELVELHKGSIEVNSQLSKGTTFMVEFPIDGAIYAPNERKGQEPIEEAIDADQLLQNEDTLPAPKEKIIKNNDITLLVVEDNEDLQELIVNSLSHYYNVLQAKNGVEALEIVTHQEIDIVVSDVMMPEMDGLTLCSTIKANIDISHTPVLLLTAKNQIEDRIACYNAGADAYISKPFDMEVLLARIKSLLQNRQKQIKEYQSSLSITPKNYENDSIDAAFLKEAIALVEKNLGDFDFTHEQLIEAMNTSKSTLYRKIKSLTGLAPSEFVRNIRLKHACLMLQNETGNISDIAYSVGFNDPKYFSTCFKNEFGVSPREYLKQLP